MTQDIGESISTLRGLIEQAYGYGVNTAEAEDALENLISTLQDREATYNIPGNGHPEFRRILEDMWEMHLSKGADYGADQDTFANVRAAADFGIPAWIGAVIRGNDKMARIQSFARKGTLENESLEDSLIDLASYAIIALILYRESPSHLMDVGDQVLP